MTKHMGRGFSFPSLALIAVPRSRSTTEGTKNGADFANLEDLTGSSMVFDNDHSEIHPNNYGLAPLDTSEG